ncbi:ATP-binding protein [Streptomyces sp. URMC 129]|uniref:ATP-binding protein n=1 Tax=Streptomyces sp. URMC 129 TaxID=3423407 RepID=UPI003F1D8898
MAFPVTAPGHVRPPRAGTERSVGAFRLPARPRSVGEARIRVRETLTRWGVPAETVDDAELIVSELVTNAVVHTGTEAVVCALRHGGGRLRIEVTGRRTGLAVPRPRAARADDENGRGLALIEALCTAWGVTDATDGRGRTVWAALATGPRS